MQLKDIAIILGIVVNAISVIAIFFKIAYGQGQAKEREERRDKDFQDIKIKLDNHIKHISDDISKIVDELHRQGERISKIEGRLNGKN